MKPHGIKVTDPLGATYTRYDTEGVYRSIRGISTELLQLGGKLDEMSLNRAIRHCERMRNGMCWETIYKNE